MNVEAYNLDSLRKLIRDLQSENKALKMLLEKAGIPYAESEAFLSTPNMSEEYDPDQGARISQQYIDRKLATQFFGAEKMCLLRGRRAAIIIPSAVTAGIRYARSKGEKGSSARSVRIQAGQSLRRNF